MGTLVALGVGCQLIGGAGDLTFRDAAGSGGSGAHNPAGPDSSSGTRTTSSSPHATGTGAGSTGSTGGAAASGGGGSSQVGTGGSTTSAGGGSAGGGGPGCTAPSDCPPAGVCLVATCTATICGIDHAGDGDTCSTGVCLAGACVECRMDADCTGNPAGSFCNDGAHACTTAACVDNVKNHQETDVDCGGPTCPGCVAGLVCLTGTDCLGGICNGVCAATCSDGAQNQDETGIDCGGSQCGPCPAGSGCAVDGDCASGFCAPSSPPVCQDPICGDGYKNAAETDVDCGGGTCGPCGIGLLCATATDCATGVCNASGHCDDDCMNSVRDGDESDVDCGGSGTCPRCHDQQFCVTTSDCDVDLTCLVVADDPSVMECFPTTCTDGMTIAPETGTDCGGGDCPKCSPGAACLVDADCISGTCDGGNACM